MALTRQDFDKLRCANPECKDPDCSDIMTIGSACHPDHVPVAWYSKTTGCIRFECPVCGKPVVEIAVALGTTH